MWNIIILLIGIAISVGASRKGRRPRKRYQLREVKFSVQLALSTLATKTVLPITLTGAADGAYRCVSINATWNIAGMTEPEGPIIVGYNHSDYTVTEIKECLEAGTSISVGLKVEQEQSNRLVRRVGSLESGLDDLNDGKPVKTRLNWLMPIGKSVEMFAYNDGSGTMTTGAILRINGSMWVKDSS